MATNQKAQKVEKVEVTELHEKCEICQKTLTREQAQAKGMGHRCEQLKAEGWTGEKLSKHYASITVPEPPKGWIKVADLHRKIDKVKHNYPGLNVSKMVRAMGKDRSIEDAAHPVIKPVYVGRTRYLDPWNASDAGLKALASGDWSKAPEPKK